MPDKGLAHWDDLMQPSGSGISFHVRLTPKAAANKIDRLERGAGGEPRLRASVTTVPEKGKANAALIKLLSKTIGLPKRDIQLIAGETSRNKVIGLRGDPQKLMTDVAHTLVCLGIMTNT